MCILCTRKHGKHTHSSRIVREWVFRNNRAPDDDDDDDDDGEEGARVIVK